MEIDDPMVEEQYKLLDILDNKASGLLMFNAIFLASIAVWLGYVPLNYLHLSLDITFLAMAISCVFLLQVIFLRWKEPEDTAEHLEWVRKTRSSTYRLAWRISFVATTLLIVVSAVHTFGTAMKASGNCRSACQYFFSEEVFGNLDYRGGR
ncbi:hypothetical protein [Afifella pfennigii]|uniref:hypothetical protein n=1 Tax=Afifella pfennigii TaxID=209897 RepID=UPI00047C0822|nr:hypothetical protein [Afifella pfennigii]